jgi:hypothetical protein
VREQGYAVWTGPGGLTEKSTFTCCHCNSIVFLKAKAPAEECGGFCRLCMKPICSKCCDKACVPFEKRLEQMESRDRMLRSVGV